MSETDVISISIILRFGLLIGGGVLGFAAAMGGVGAWIWGLKYGRWLALCGTALLIASIWQWVLI